MVRRGIGMMNWFGLLHTTLRDEMTWDDRGGIDGWMDGWVTIEERLCMAFGNGVFIGYPYETFFLWAN